LILILISSQINKQTNNPIISNILFSNIARYKQESQDFKIEEIQKEKSSKSSLSEKDPNKDKFSVTEKSTTATDMSKLISNINSRNTVD